MFNALINLFDKVNDFIKNMNLLNKTYGLYKIINLLGKTYDFIKHDKFANKKGKM